MPEEPTDRSDTFGDLAFPPGPGHLIRRAHQISSALWAEHVGTALTPPQYLVLRALVAVDALDQVSITQVAALDRSTLADVLVRLEAKKLVRRDRNKADARRNLVSLTERGRELLESVTPAVTASERELVACFDELDLDAFLGQLGVLVAHGEQRLTCRQEGRRGVPAGALASGVEEPAAAGHPGVDQ